jgi:hypothetical protein
MAKRKNERRYTLEEIKNEFFPNRSDLLFDGHMKDVDNKALDNAAFQDFLRKASQSEQKKVNSQRAK